jgi:phosphoribulokinase
VGTKVPMTHEGNVSEKPMMRMQWVQKYHWSMRDLFYSSSAGTLTFVRTVETFIESLCHRNPNDSQ